MPPSTAKKVALYRFDRQPAEGLVNPAAYLLDDHLELMTLEGNLQTVLYSDLKALCFISDSAHFDLFKVHTSFERRPKSPGLWTRFTFRDGDQLDGLLSHNLLDWPQAGYLVVPPFAGATRQRVFLPRQAIIRTDLRGVVGTGGATSQGHKKDRQQQLRMFE